MNMKCCLHLLIAAVTLSVQLPVQANVFEGEKLPYLLQAKPQKPIDLQKRNSILDDYLKPVNTGAAAVTPIPLHGVRIPGLTSKTVDTLGFNNFVVVNNQKNARMSDLYRDNRLNGKANFVTTDCVLHPYIAFTNRVLADTAEKVVAADLRHLLKAMLEQSAIDYTGTDDVAVREDIEKNIAYLAVALKLLDPSYEVIKIGHVSELIDHDLRNIRSGIKGISDIFDREEDFKSFRPIGWYKSSEGLANFFRAREWLARMSFPITDVAVGGSSKSNNFRRSVLLFRALELARIDDKPALETWDRVMKELALLAPQPNSWRDRVLYPSDYKLVFKNDKNNLRDTLNGLSEPFYRTKLLLAVRRQKPMNLGSASIFEMESDAAQREASALFRLFPITGDPEIAWMQSIAKLYPSDQEGGTWLPVALADLSAWGSGHAGNLLLENKISLDPALNKTYPDLYRSIVVRSGGGSQQPIVSRQWQLFSHYFKPFSDAAQVSLRGEMWLTHRLESAFAAWVASVSCIAPPHADAPQPQPVATAAASPANSSAAQIGSATSYVPNNRKPGPTSYHFLEPDAPLFAAIQADANSLMQQLTQLGCLQPYQKHRFADFIRLSARLESIAETQGVSKPLTAADRGLLGNIDTVLDKVDMPLPTVLSFSGGTFDSRFKQHPGAGFNLALGRPGYLHVLIQNPRTTEWTLARGAVYSYYEFAGQPVTLSDWQHVLNNNQARPPAWTRQFDIVQPATKSQPDQTANKAEPSP